MILDWTKRELALFLAGSATNRPTYFMLGSGSGTVVSTQTTLFNPFDGQEATSVTGSTIYKIKYQGDWNSVEMSGIQLREFAICGSSSTITGSIWSRTTFPAITFDGTNELRVEETWTVY